ncbi:MAG TPA: T9SS type A sorting domain-containing protein, partial [Bacteroidota bacterium]|nr:T9SS type A sorting domain-containing protein [Bacteroidota bacterium]
ASLAALGWGQIGHFLINTKAVDNLPPSMSLFINAGSYFGAHASDADYRKGSDPTEAPKHFIDIDWYPAFQNLSPNADSLVGIYGASRVTTNGILPWATLQTYDSLVASLRRGATARAESIAADLGHYVGDGHQPLHVALNYDGQLTGNDGVHSRYETTMINAYASKITVTPVPAVYVQNRFAYIMAYLLVSNSLADSVIQADNGAKAVSGWNGSGAVPTAYTAELWNETRSLTDREMQDATVSLANLWYSAWVDAGLIAEVVPGRTLPVAVSLSQNYPNPFNPSTGIKYSLAAAGQVTLNVYSTSGALVGTLASGFQPPGEHEVRFNASGLASGVYIYRLQQGGFSASRKMLLIR